MWKFENSHPVPTQGSPALARLSLIKTTNEGKGGAARGEFKSASASASAARAASYSSAAVLADAIDAQRADSVQAEEFSTEATRRAAMQSLARADAQAALPSDLIADDELRAAIEVGEGEEAMLEAKARAARHADRRARAELLRDAARQASSMEEVARLRAERKMTALQRHSDFFDENKDGEISLLETYRGLRRMGFNFFLAVGGMLLINLTTAWLTRDSWLPDWKCSINIKNIQRCKHGSDTAVYDHEGRMSFERLEYILGAFEREGKKGLRLSDVLALCKRNQEMTDPIGWIANCVEWVFTWWVAQDEHGVMSLESVRGVYDGSLFYLLEERYSQRPVTRKWWAHTMLAPAQWAASKLSSISVVQRAMRLAQRAVGVAQQKVQQTALRFRMSQKKAK